MLSLVRNSVLILFNSVAEHNNVLYMKDPVYRFDNQTIVCSTSLPSVILCWTLNVSEYSHPDTQRRWMALTCLELPQPGCTCMLSIRQEFMQWDRKRKEKTSAKEISLLWVETLLKVPACVVIWVTYIPIGKALCLYQIKEVL